MASTKFWRRRSERGSVDETDASQTCVFLGKRSIPTDSDRAKRACHAMVSMIFRARVSSFLAGFAIASGFAVYQLRSDVRESHVLLAEQADGVEKRLKQIEAFVAKQQ